jgi:hypothetical protein
MSKLKKIYYVINNNEYQTMNKKKPFYYYSAKVMEHIVHLYENKIPKEIMVKYLIYKILDGMVFSKRMVLLEEIFKINSLQNKTPLHIIIYDYFKERMLPIDETNEDAIIGLTKITMDINDDETATFVLYKQDKTTKEWKQVTTTELKQKYISKIIKYLKVNTSTIHTKVGFYMVDVKKYKVNNPIFTIRDRSGIRNKGFDIVKSGKQTSLHYLNYFVSMFNEKENTNISYTTNIIEKNHISQLEICIIVEILMRYLRYAHNEMVFLTQEESSLEDYKFLQDVVK